MGGAVPEPAPLVGKPVLIYNGKVIGFHHRAMLEDIRQPVPVVMTNRALSGAFDSVTVRMDVRCRFVWDVVVNAHKQQDLVLRRKLAQWHQWAASGLPWWFSIDASRTSQTALTTPAAHSQATVNIQSDSGFSVGDACIIRTSVRMEEVQIEHVADDVITLTEPLNFTYPAGSVFRHANYWRGRLANPAQDVQFRDRFPEVKAFHYGFSFEFEEAMQ